MLNLQAADLTRCMFAPCSVSKPLPQRPLGHLKRWLMRFFWQSRYDSCQHWDSWNRGYWTCWQRIDSKKGWDEGSERNISQLLENCEALARHAIGWPGQALVDTDVLLVHSMVLVNASMTCCV